MIRHRPFGSGHPYSVDTDQRHPLDPVAGAPLTLGVRATPDVTAVSVEIETTDPDGVAHRWTESLEPVVRRSRGETLDGGHLASAQARLARSSGGWAKTLTAPDACARVKYRFTGGDAATRWFETRVSAWRDGADRVQVIGVDRIVPRSVTILTDGDRVRRVRFALALATGEHVTGFGERYDALDHRGTSLDSVVFEQYKSQGAERKTYLPMPFAHVVGGEGWGFHVRTSRRVWFDIGESDASTLWIEAETDAADHGHVLEMAFYEGSPREVLAAFVGEVGRPEELPDWVFRLWASGNEWNTQAEVLRQAELHRRHDIPVGSIVIEAWSDESTFTAFRDARYEPSADGAAHRLADFDFPADGAWPDPVGMVDELHGQGIRVHLWQIPLLKARPHPSGQARADAEAAIREGVLIREPDSRGGLRPYRNRGWWFPLSLMPDLTDERAARWWTEKRRYLVDEVGIDGFKTDGGEHAWGRELVYLDGCRGDEKNALFAVAYAKAYGDLLRRSGKAPVTFSRAGFTGSQAHGAFWAGDENSTWDAFRWSLYAGLSAASSGIVYWGWDIAGFSGDLPTAELYIRAMAASVFVPIMQYHSEFNHHRRPLRDRTPWNIADETGDERVIPVTRALVKLRERLVPYLAAEARHTIETSEPLMRPVFFDHPSLDTAWSHPLQWFLGRDVFVSPVVVEGVSTHPVALPPGTWVHAPTGETFDGAQIVDVDAPVDAVPAFVRAESWSRLRAVFQPE